MAKSPEEVIEEWIKQAKPNKELDLSELNLTELPNLPNTVKKLNCSYNPLKTLRNLPPNLRTLKCEGTALVRFENVPITLRYVNCSGSDLTSLDGLPDSIRYIIAHNCSELKKVYKLPAELIWLDLYYCDIERIVNIPNNVEYIDIACNRIMSLPRLPESLKTLNCKMSHRLSHVTNLPSNLEVLEINTINLNYLPSLPVTLRYLRIDSINILNNNVIPTTIEEMISTEIRFKSDTFDKSQCFRIKKL
jgi:hypothetical protein